MDKERIKENSSLVCRVSRLASRFSLLASRFSRHVPVVILTQPSEIVDSNLYDVPHSSFKTQHSQHSRICTDSGIIPCLLHPC